MDLTKRGSPEPTNRAHRSPDSRLQREASWVLVGNVFFAASQWALLVLLAKFGSIEQVGEFALANAIAAPAFMLSDLNLRAYLATDAREEFSFPTYLACRGLATSLAFLSLPAVGYALGHDFESIAVLTSVGAAKAFESLSTLIFGLYQKHDRARWLAGSLILRSVLSVSFFSLALIWTRRLDWAVLALAGARFLTFATCDLPLSRRIVGVVSLGDTSRVLRLARSALPLGMVMMLVSLNSNLVLYFVDNLLGTTAVGRFAALLYLITAARIVINALSQASSPRLARHLQRGDRAGFERLQNRLILVGLSLGLAGAAAAWLVGETVLTLAYSAEYAADNDLLVWLLAANSFAFANTFLGAGLTAMRSFRRMLGLNAVSLLLTLVFLMGLVPSLELQGAAWAVGLSAASKFFLNLALNRYSVRAATVE